MLLCGLLHNRDTIVAYYASWRAISHSKLVSNNYISNHNKRWRPHLKVKFSFYLYFCFFWINVTQINFENIKITIQSIIVDSCFQLRSWCNVEARAPSIPLQNFPFNATKLYHAYTLRKNAQLRTLFVPYLEPLVKKVPNRVLYMFKNLKGF